MYYIAPQWALMYDIISLLHDVCIKHYHFLRLTCMILEIAFERADVRL